jgi:hypothetical protein
MPATNVVPHEIAVLVWGYSGLQQNFVRGSTQSRGKTSFPIAKAKVAAKRWRGNFAFFFASGRASHSAFAALHYGFVCRKVANCHSCSKHGKSAGKSRKKAEDGICVGPLTKLLQIAGTAIFGSFSREKMPLLPRLLARKTRNIAEGEVLVRRSSSSCVDTPTTPPATSGRLWVWEPLVVC